MRLPYRPFDLQMLELSRVALYALAGFCMLGYRAASHNYAVEQN